MPLREIVGEANASRAGNHASAAKSPPGAMERVFLAHEEAARRIAQNLHDDASQMLALVYLELSDLATESSRATAERIDKITEHLDLVCEQIRGLAHELHPRTLEHHGLVTALYKLADGVSRRTGLKVTVSADIDKLPIDVELGLYRVVQEALSNVVRHADADSAEIQLWTTEKMIHCSVKDDGVGFQPQQHDSDARYGSGLGLVGIYERVGSLGGECHIRSRDQAGMELNVGIPI
jgi:two-component system sensor histidine kinase UhpB